MLDFGGELGDPFVVFVQQTFFQAFSMFFHLGLLLARAPACG